MISVISLYRATIKYRPFAVALRLGLGVCVPHSCSCGENVDAWGQHAFVCKHASGRTQRHHALNDVIARSFASAGIPVAKEPTGIYRDSVKRPDGVTLVPWQSGRALTWDVTVATTLAHSYLPASSVTAESAASRKAVKYSDLPASFQPIAVETLGPINKVAVDFLRELGRRISSKFQEERQSAYLFQRLSVTVQQFNAIILHDSFPPKQAWTSGHQWNSFYFHLAFSPRDLYYQRYKKNNNTKK